MALKHEPARVCSGDAVGRASASAVCDIDPGSSPQEFRRCLSQFATGITVITTVSGERAVGMTANSFSSLSLDPPLVVWSISRTSSRFGFFDTGKCFTVNVLSDRQTSISRHFTAAGENQFADVGWTRGHNGIPILDDVAAAFECERAGEYDGGDHRILVGRVTRALRYDRMPLLFSQGGYRIPADHPDAVPQPTATRAWVEADDLEGVVLQDLFRANHRLAAAFVQFRGALTRDEHRVLISVERRPGMHREQLAEHAFLGMHAVEDAVGNLLSQGLLEADSAGGLGLTAAGRERRRQLVGHLRDMEHRVFASVPPDVLRAGRQLLHLLAAD